MAYFYRDKANILHGTEDLSTAKEYAQGDVVSKDFTAKGGYLQIEGQPVFDYGNGEVYYGGNRNSDNHVELKELEGCSAELYGKIVATLEAIGL